MQHTHSNMDEDPFLIVKSQVEDALVDTTTLFESWKRIQQTVSSPQNQELLWTADELVSSMETIEQDLEDLEEAFNISQENPTQFNLSKQDIKDRRQFLTQSHNKLKNIRHMLANPPEKKTMEDSSASYNTARQNDNSLFIESEQQQQQYIMQQQDQQLDGISGTIVNLKEIASTMNREVEDHVVILDELGYQVDRSEGRLKGAMRRVTDILRREEEAKSGYCICCLIIVLIVLLIMVIMM